MRTRRSRLRDWFRRTSSNSASHRYIGRASAPTPADLGATVRLPPVQPRYVPLRERNQSLHAHRSPVRSAVGL